MSRSELPRQGDRLAADPAALADSSAAPAAELAHPAEGQRSGTLLLDALMTIATRFVLAIIIFGSDVLIARILGPTAKGRFALIMLYAQLAAVPVAWGTDNALAVVAGRDASAARRGMANAIWWSILVGGACVGLSWWLYRGGSGVLAELIPNLSSRQFLYGAIALPGEVFFAVGLFGLLGRRRMAGYNAVRILRRGILVVLILAVAAIGVVDLDLALAMNVGAVFACALAIVWVAHRDGTLGLRPDPRLLVEELRFGSRAIVGSIAERLQLRLDSFLLNAMVNVRATGIYSVTSGLAETLWYIPNSLGTVMFSRAVDPTADASRAAAVLTRTTIVVTAALAIPAWFAGPRLVAIVYGRDFADAGVALRWILPGVVAYSVVAVLSRYVVGRGRPGLGTVVLVAGLATNLVANLILIPRFGIVGAAASSSISYVLTALLTLVAFVRISGRGVIETLVVQRRDLVALVRFTANVIERLRGRRAGPVLGLPGGEAAAELVISEHEPSEEH